MSDKERLVVVGGVAAGMSAASKARRMDADLEILVYEKSGYVSYGACGLPYYVQGLIPDHHHLIARTPAQFAQRGIQTFTHHEVTHIDPQAQAVQVRNLDEGTTFETDFDKLVLATGGHPVRPPIPGIDFDNVFVVRTVEDGVAIRRFIQEEKPGRAVIIGGGYIGLEMAEGLSSHDLQVSLVGPQLLKMFDADMSTHLEPELARHGVEFFLERRVQALEGKNGRAISVHAGDVELPADLVILAAGVRPTVALAEAAGIALGPTGAVAVDEQQRTNLPDIWAAGDVAEAHHRVTGEPAYLPLGTTANKQGRVAGENLAGGNAQFPGIVGTAVVKVFELDAARAGLSESEAREKGFEVKTTAIKAPSQAHYMPGGGPLHVKLVYQPDGRLLGVQMVGVAAAKRIDVAAAALQAGWSIQALTELDLSYAPPFAPVWDPLLIAANVAAK